AVELIKSYEEHGGRFRYMGQHLLNLFSGCKGARAYRRYLSEHLGDEKGEEVLIKAFSFCKGS
ncbi:MAG: tRNA dihydrouridine(20/20a) synthase DusA, partial [Succinatimonas sp.]|nr:tRNA dihydrouridine(20/20a) synthase DusA [Succinatimonas sp.]